MSPLASLRSKMSNGDSCPGATRRLVGTDPIGSVRVFEGARRSTSQVIAAIRAIQNSPMKTHPPAAIPPSFHPIISVSSRVRVFVRYVTSLALSHEDPDEERQRTDRDAFGV